MTQLLGIVNITPDSFSDGGKYTVMEAALDHMRRLLEEGADVLDIGAESTRPGAVLLEPEQEWARLSPLLGEARSRFPQAALSLDTRHAATAEKALALGVDWINDVSGGADPRMQEVIAGGACRYVVMHSLSMPPKPGECLPENACPVQWLADWAGQRVAELERAGVARQRLVLDVGIGFGKSPAQTWEILRGWQALQQAVPLDWLAGHSRKSFFGRVGDGSATARDLETHALSAYLAQQSAAFLRVHDVAGAKRAIALGQQLRKE